MPLISDLSALLSAPAISAFIGGSTGIAGSWFAYHRERKHKAHSTFVAIQAEILSIVRLMEFGDYEKGMNLAIQHIESTNTPFFLNIEVDIELFTKVYSANVSNIGSLKKKHLPDIVMFYANIHALLMDLKHLNQTDPPQPINPTNQLYVYRKDLPRVTETIALGKAISKLKY